MRIVLASKSPRRRELLTQVGIEFECAVSNKEENITSTIPSEVVLQLSKQKADDVWQLMNNDGAETENGLVVIGADTVVAYGETIMGKPVNREAAVSMLKTLRGNVHSVWTGVTLLYIKNGKVMTEVFSQETKVYMYNMSDSEIEEYVDSGEPGDKAGSYAIQGLGARFVEKIEGDYNNVVGLPVSRVYQSLKKIVGN